MGNVGIGTTTPRNPLHVTTPAVYSDVTTNLQLYLPFNDSTNDISGNNKVITTIGSISYVNSVYDTLGKAVNISNPGSSPAPTNYIQCASPTLQVPLSFTFWMYIPSSIASGEMFSLCDGTGGLSTQNINMDIVNNQIFTYIALPSYWSVAGLSSPILQNSTWYHIALTITSTWVCTLHVNGVAYHQLTGTANFASTTKSQFVWIGRQGDGITRGFNGYVDEFRMYNRALSIQEIGTLYSFGDNRSTFMVTNNMDIGIGTLQPKAKLHVQGTLYAPNTVCKADFVKIVGNNGAALSYQADTNIGQFEFTPTFVNSKIVFTISVPCQAGATYFNIFLRRNGTARANDVTSLQNMTYGLISYNSSVNIGGHLLHYGSCYDLPNTTSTITYYIMASANATSIILYNSGSTNVVINEICQ